MYAADDRIGVLLNENTTEETPEWIEWNLDGVVINRVPLDGVKRFLGRAFDGRGKLYAQFPIDARAGQIELKALDVESRRWVPVRPNLPEGTRAFLFGADGERLVYGLNVPGNVHLVWARPE
jgi:hypothetical protein